MRCVAAGKCIDTKPTLLCQQHRKLHRPLAAKHTDYLRWVGGIDASKAARGGQLGVAP